MRARARVRTSDIFSSNILMVHRTDHLLWSIDRGLWFIKHVLRSIKRILWSI